MTTDRQLIDSESLQVRHVEALVREQRLRDEARDKVDEAWRIGLMEYRRRTVELMEASVAEQARLNYLFETLIRGMGHNL